MVGCTSIHHAAPGISFISLLLSIAKHDHFKYQSELNSFLEEINKPSDKNDTTLGRLSSVLAILELKEQFVNPQQQALEELITVSGTKILNDVWQTFENGKAIGAEHSWKNLGFAHGWAGLLYTTLLWSYQNNVELPSSFYQRVNQLSDKLTPRGRGLEIEWLNEEGKAIGAMAGWCNGSAGVLHLYSLMYEYDNNAKWLEIARGLAWNVWESQDSIVDLCCGIAGRIFALQKIASIDNGAINWQEKSAHLAQRGLEHAEKIQSEDHPPHSLFKGQLGVALAAECVLSEGEITMPLMGRC